MTARLILGDNVEVLRTFADASVAAVVTDPPYGLSTAPDMTEVLQHWLAGDDYTHRGGGFMGKTWDSFVPGPAFWREVYRVLKPGGHMLVFGGTRTFDLLTLAIRLAGFEIRDSIHWMYGSGFPKSMDVSKAIDKADRGVPQGSADPSSPNHGRYRSQATEGKRDPSDTGSGYGAGGSRFLVDAAPWQRAAGPLTDAAKRWAGYGTALKPGHEPIILARKPLDGTMAHNVLTHGVGALNIDGCRVAFTSMEDFASAAPGGAATSKDTHVGAEPDAGNAEERVGFTPKIDRKKLYTHSRGKGYDGPAFNPMNPMPDRVQPGQELGRWPPNVVFSHHPDCRPAGTREVAGSGHWPAARGNSTVAGGQFGGFQGQTELPERHETTTIAVWNCVPGCPVAALDAQSGATGAAAPASSPRGIGGSEHGIYNPRQQNFRVDGAESPFYADKGGASRFYPTFAFEEDDFVPFRYVAKAARSEREAGCEALPPRSGADAVDREEGTAGLNSPRAGAGRTAATVRNHHPTVKPVALMRWCVRLVTPPGGTVLDPFVGSGTTTKAASLEGFDSIGIEQDPDYMAIAEARTRAPLTTSVPAVPVPPSGVALFEQPVHEAPRVSFADILTRLRLE